MRLRHLRLQGVKVANDAGGTVRDAVNAFNEGKLPLADGANVEGQWKNSCNILINNRGVPYSPDILCVIDLVIVINSAVFHVHTPGIIGVLNILLG